MQAHPTGVGIEAVSVGLAEALLFFLPVGIIYSVLVVLTTSRAHGKGGLVAFALGALIIPMLMLLQARPLLQIAGVDAWHALAVFTLLMLPPLALSSLYAWRSGRRPNPRRLFVRVALAFTIFLVSVPLGVILALMPEAVAFFSSQGRAA